MLVRCVRAELGGGVVLTQIHDYDLACWLFGAPRRVTASGGRPSLTSRSTVEWLTPMPCSRGIPGHRVRSADVRVAPAVASHCGRWGNRCSAELDLLPRENDIHSRRLRRTLRSWDYQRNQMFMDEASDFLDSVDRHEQPAVTLDDGVTALRVALAVKESIRSGRTVELT